MRPRPRLRPLLDRSRAVYLADGNSQTEGINGPNSAFPYRLGLLLGQPVRNFGVGGQTTPSMRRDVVPQVVAAMQAGADNVLIASEVRNDLVARANAGNLGSIVRACVDEQWGYFEDVKAAATVQGKRVHGITWTILDCQRTSNAIGIGALRELFAEANALIQAEWPLHCASYFDTAADPRLRDANNVAYFADKVHLTGAGEAIQALGAYQAVVNLRA